MPYTILLPSTTPFLTRRSWNVEYNPGIASRIYLFVLIPAVIFLLLGPLALLRLRRKASIVDGSTLKIAKLTGFTALAALELTRAAYWAKYPPISPTYAWTTGVLATVAALVAGTISVLHHSRSLRPSSFLNIALLIATIVEAIVVGLLWSSTHTDRVVRLVSIAVTVINGVLFALEVTEKKSFFYHDHDRQRSPGETSGIFSRALLSWVNPLLVRGFRTSLKPTDLYSLDESLQAHFLHTRFERAWNNSTATEKRRLLNAVVKALGKDLVAPVIARLVLIAFTVCQPLLVQAMLEFLQNQSTPQRNGYWLIGAYVVTYGGMAIANSIYWVEWSRCLTTIRGMLSTAVFHHTTSIPVSLAEEKTAVTLMSTDIDRITNGIRDIHELWANAIQIGIATYLLQRELDYACVAPVVISGLAFVSTTYLSRWTRIFQKKWMAQVQRRVSLLTSLLGSIQGVKLSGLTPQLSTIISQSRRDEVNASRDFRLLGAVTSTIALFPLMLSPVMAFGLYAMIAQRRDATLDVSRLFMSLSILLLLSQPLFSLFGSLVSARASISCFERIEQYLLSSSVQKKEPNESSMSASQLKNTSVILEGASFGWSSSNEPLLNDLNITILARSLTLLIGPSGAGKSTLIKGILGEVPSRKGKVQLNRSGGLAFCDQTPWLWNGTIKENILGFAELDQIFYESVLRACDLKKDLKYLPQGDDTPVGSKGSSLSGGQKQRITMARAVYQKPKVVVFDDVLSGLDAQTTRVIWDRLFARDGLLSSLGATVILATHAIDIMSSVDHIVVIDNGTVSEQGSFSALRTKNGYVDRLYTQYVSSSSLGLSSVADDQEEVVVDPVKAEAVPTQQTSTKKPDPQGKEESEKVKSTSDWSVYRFYFRSIGTFSMVAFLCLEIAWAFFSSFPVIWLEWWTKSNEIHPNSRLGYYIGVYAGFQVAGLLSSALLTWFCFSLMARNSGISLHNTALKTLMAAPMAYFNRTSAGAITTRFSQDMGMVDFNLPLQLLTFFQNLFVCIAQIGLIGSGVGWIAISFPALILVFLSVQVCYLRTAKQLRLLDLSEKGPLYTQFLDTLGGLAVIRAFGWEKSLQTKNFRLVDRSQRPYYLLLILQRWLTVVLDLITMGLAVLVAGLAVGLRDRISASGTAVSLTQIISFTSYVKQLITTRTSLETTLGAISRLKYFSETTESESDPAGCCEPPASWPGAGQVEFRNISARYDTESTHHSLKDVSISIPGGKKVGICGRTGSGKSSLVLALFRVLNTEQGQVLIDGVDIATLDPQLVRSRLNGLGQELYFLSGTVRQNLDPYGAHDDERLTQAVAKTALGPTIEALGGLNASLSAEKLSHGQRQLFSLARALLRPGRIVVLDEITSNIDRETEQAMQQIIRSEFSDRTVISVAHRLDTISDFDLVAVMQDGACVEFDNPAALLQRASRFRELYEAYRATNIAEVTDAV